MMKEDRVRITESPRDAMQGLGHFIATADKIRYVQSLLDVGFHTLDVGSFVSPKAVPQMQDTGKVVDALDRNGKTSRILAIVGNMRGAQEAFRHRQLDAVGFPFSISESFLRNNINSDLQRSSNLVTALASECRANRKELVIYLSMAFGNPYGDEWSVGMLADWIDRLKETGVKEFALSDTIGISNPDIIHSVFSALIPGFPELEFSFHLHTGPEDWKDKLEAAFSNGCRAFDGVMNGLGGCPMTGHGLVANIDTSLLIGFFLEKGIACQIDKEAFRKSWEIGEKLFTFPVNNLD